jgi:very-short-patch-repair endonuclease
VLAAIFDGGPGTVLHGPSTLAWFALRGHDLRTIHVARARGQTSTPTVLGVVHRLRALRAHHVIVARGVPTETPLRAIWSEAARLSNPKMFEIGVTRVGRLLDDAHVAKLVTWAALHEMVDDIRERGRAGTTIMRALAAERRPGSSPTESRNEDQLEKILANTGVRPLSRQHVVGGHEPIGRSDYRDLDLPLVVEVNSLTHHTSPSDREADEVRYRLLNDAGFTVAVIWEDDLWSAGSWVVRTVGEARRMATAGEPGVLHSPSCPWPDPRRLPRTLVLGPHRCS